MAIDVLDSDPRRLQSLCSSSSPNNLVSSVNSKNVNRVMVFMARELHRHGNAVGRAGDVLCGGYQSEDGRATIRGPLHSAKRDS